MPKGIREPYQELEGGKSFGGMGGSGGGGRATTRYKVLEKPKNPSPEEVKEGLIAGFAGLGAPTVAGLGYAMTEESSRRRAEAERKEKADRQSAAELKRESRGMKNGGMTASKRADGCAIRGKTRGKIV
jgi:hypothetical protein